MWLQDVERLNKQRQKTVKLIHYILYIVLGLFMVILFGVGVFIYQVLKHFIS